MSSSTHEQMASPTGHATRAVLSTQRRNEIWENVYKVAMQPPNTGRWCTREELVEVTMAQTPLKCTAHELTEVMRGKKHKLALGVESKKVEGEYRHRFVMPGMTSPLQSDPLKFSVSGKQEEMGPPPTSTTKAGTGASKPASTPSSSKKRTPARSPSTTKAAVPRSKPAKTPSTPKRNGSTTKKSRANPKPSKSEETAESTSVDATTTRQTITPRPRSGAARAASSKSPGLRSSRKRRLDAVQPENEEQEGASLRAATAKKHRVPADTKTVTFDEGRMANSQGSGEQAGDGGGGRAGDGAAGAKAKGTNSWCTIM